MNITDDGMNVLAPGLGSIRSLKRLRLSHNSIGDVGLKVLADGLVDLVHLWELFLGSNTFSAIGLKSLSRALQTLSVRHVDLSENSIDGKGLQFMTGMKECCTIERLDLTSNAISSGIQSFPGVKFNNLRELYLQGTNIGDNDRAMEGLVEAMESLCNLEHLSLPRVTTLGLSVLAPIFQSEKCCLKVLYLYDTNLEDNGAVALSNGLRGNKSLTKVIFWRGNVTDVGWDAFERLLCDTSSVNNTYCSNHTLQEIGYGHPASIKLKVQDLLRLNKLKYLDCGVNVPICKILMSHSHINMIHSLQWKFELFPFVVKWFERARSNRVTNYFGLQCIPETLIESMLALKRRKLSAVYQFIGSASHSIVKFHAYSKKYTVTTAVSRKRKINWSDRE